MRGVMSVNISNLNLTVSYQSRSHIALSLSCLGLNFKIYLKDLLSEFSP